MPLDIKMPDGSNFNANSTGFANAQAHAAMTNAPPVRTIAVVAGELEAAMTAALRIPALRDELAALLGKKKRGPRKTGA